MRQINKVVVHCADTPASMDIGVREIDQWHKARGWTGIGYHYVIRRDGTIDAGRDVNVVGAHAYGHNKGSLGVCLVGGKGGFNFTMQQLDSLRILRKQLDAFTGPVKWVGHAELDAGKACPNFDVQALFS